MTIAFSSRLRALAICSLAVLASGAGLIPAQAQSIVVMVNGDPITDYDIEQRMKLNFLSTRKQQSRQEVINELIDDKVVGDWATAQQVNAGARGHPPGLGPGARGGAGGGRGGRVLMRGLLGILNGGERAGLGSSGRSEGRSRA